MVNLSVCDKYNKCEIIASIVKPNMRAVSLRANDDWGLTHLLMVLMEHEIMDLRLTAWSEKLVFGIDKIDSQHKQLFDLAATFEGDGDQIRVMRTLAELCGYIKVHFKEEEDLLADCGYPKLNDHKALHIHFKKMLSELLANAKSMTLDDIANQVQFLINGWFYNHIMVADLDYVSFVKANETLNEAMPAE